MLITLAKIAAVLGCLLLLVTLICTLAGIVCVVVLVVDAVRPELKYRNKKKRQKQDNKKG